MGPFMEPNWQPIVDESLLLNHNICNKINDFALSHNYIAFGQWF